MPCRAPELAKSFFLPAFMLAEDVSKSQIRETGLSHDNPLLLKLWAQLKTHTHNSDNSTQLEQLKTESTRIGAACLLQHKRAASLRFFPAGENSVSQTSVYWEGNSSEKTTECAEPALVHQSKSSRSWNTVKPAGTTSASHKHSQDLLVPSPSPSRPSLGLNLINVSYQIQ